MYSATVGALEGIYALKINEVDACYDLFLRECNVLSYLPAHPHITQLVAVVCEGDRLVGMLQEHCPGGDLQGKQARDQEAGKVSNEMEVWHTITQVRARCLYSL